MTTSKIIQIISLEVLSFLYAWVYLQPLQFVSGISYEPYCLCHALFSTVRGHHHLSMALSATYSPPYRVYSSGSFPSFSGQSSGAPHSLEELTREAIPAS